MGDISPLLPLEADPVARHAMDFVALEDPLFGDEETPAADVDLASVVWGQSSANEGSGDIVEFLPDHTKWVVAVAVQDNPNGAFVRFLNQDGDAQSGEFAALFVTPQFSKCRLARVDCTYLGGGSLQVYVACRLGIDQYDPPAMLG
jgi:hypothetical protein